MKFQIELFEKYNIPTPRYTSYPPANYFKEVTDDKPDISKIIRQSNQDKPKNISLYIHIPFCGQLCLYCGCNTHITQNKETMTKYVDTLIKEIDLLASHLDKNRKVSQIHWGGGTPNYLPIEEIERIMEKLHEQFDFISHPEIAMECHPAHLTKEYTKKLVEMGFNRLSFGVQDFSDKVLDTVHREKPLLPIEEMVKYIKSFKNLSLNLDFIYGLPYQSIDAYKKTIKKAIELSPDRLAVFSYAHVPWIKKQQKSLEKYGLPTAKEKIELFESAYNLLSENKYEIIGLDHFAKPDDELSIALKNKKLHRNFQGYCTLETTGQVYALGVSGISQMENAYLQNTKDLKKYEEEINKGNFPVEKYYLVSEEEKIIRDIIENIMCNMEVSLEEIARKYKKNIKEIYTITQVDTEALSQYEEEGFLSFNDHRLRLTPKGQFFMRIIAAAFDPNMKNNKKNFSKAL
jgi:oxygen-independent coproporphyrinogen-3 oxidase